MTFGEYVKYYEDAILSMGKVSSIKSTKSRLRKVVAEFGDKEMPLSPMDIQRFVTSLSSKYSAQTVHNCWITMKTVLLRAKAEGLVSEVPDPVLPKIEKQEQEWFQPLEMRALAHYNNLYAVAAETGMRIGEMLAVQNQDIDLEKRTLSIRRNIYDGVISTPKTRAGNRTLSISKWLSSVLERQIGTSPEAYLFSGVGGRALNPDYEVALLRRACGVFGISPAGFHAFRRGNATLQASIIGVPEKLIAYRLGHSNLGLTLGRYAKYLVGMDREAAEQIGEILK